MFTDGFGRRIQGKPNLYGLASRIDTFGHGKGICAATDLFDRAPLENMFCLPPPQKKKTQVLPMYP